MSEAVSYVIPPDYRLFTSTSPTDPEIGSNGDWYWLIQASQAILYQKVACAWVQRAVINGGTGMADPMTTAGDMIYRDSGNVTTRLPAGSNGQILKVVAGEPTWSAESTGSGTVTSVGLSVPAFLSASGTPVTTSGTLAVSLSGTALPEANGGTGETTYSQGQLLIGNAAGGLTKATLTQGSNVTISNGDGAITISASASGAALTVKEVDGAPSVSNVSTIVVSNGTMTDDGGGQVTITTGGGGAGSTDGWTAAAEAWTYASATTFTVASDVTGIYSKGDKVKLTQTTVKYFYIVGVSFATGTTTITVSGGSDYSLASAAIGNAYYSKQATPNAFPQWFNWSPTLTGFSADPTGNVYRFSVVGTTTRLAIRQATAGTSNSNALTISMPVTTANITNDRWVGACRTVDNGTLDVALGLCVTTPASTTLTIVRGTGDGTFTSSGGKAISAAEVCYEF